MSVRLACIRHAASVYPEPGSNSPLLSELFVSSILYVILFVCISSICSVFKDPFLLARVFSRALLFYHTHISKSTIIYRENRVINQTRSKPKMPDLAIKKPGHPDPAAWLRLVQSDQAENIVVGYENEERYQQEEDDRVQGVLKLLIRLFLRDRLIADEDDPAAVKRRYRQQVDDPEVDAQKADPIQKRQESLAGGTRSDGVDTDEAGKIANPDLAAREQ